MLLAVNGIINAFMCFSPSVWVMQPKNRFSKDADILWAVKHTHLAKLDLIHFSKIHTNQDEQRNATL